MHLVQCPPSPHQCSSTLDQTRSWSVEKDKICYLSQLKHLDMNAIVLGKHARRTSFLKPKPSSVWEWTNGTNNNHCAIFIFFWLLFLAATPYHVIPCNFLLLFFSGIYSVYSWFFLINLMNTGIGHWKYCIPQPFSRCLFSLCSSLFDFNSILKQWLCKILGAKQGTLWSMWRWWILSCSCGERPRTHFPAVGGHLNGWMFSK